ncbi:MAG: 2-phospho-L-lactate guanylyltransferase [Candidatus Hecatellales archaeon]|nr:MAG: 2-phospho-L-lactate guanylyltransferase [Candidatus Hecatellales archaeon]RLI33806.1 MAG: 2-phospho-L-lactate guanylyltransferase [Candidatus Bathyarchaeota archaeon]
MGGLKVYTVIPVKSLAGGKRRLAGILGRKQRETLTLCMLRDVLSTVLGCPKIEEAVVVSSDPEVLRLAGRLGAVALAEGGDHGVNEAVSRGIAYCVARGASLLLILPADIPLLSSLDLETLASLGLKSSLVLTPSLRLDGTNALLLKPPEILQTSYDADSFRSHLSAGRLRGLRVKVYLSGRVMLDLDLPEDLELFLRLEASRNTETYRYASEVLEAGVRV